MKVYLAGKFEEHDRLRDAAYELRGLGHTITCPWFDKEVGPSIDLPLAAVRDVRGVRESETCIFFFEKQLPYKGALSELGMAIALDKRVIVIGHGADKNVFTHYPLVERAESFEEVIEWLK